MYFSSFFHLKKANGKATIANPSLQLLIPANTRGRQRLAPPNPCSWLDAPSLLLVPQFKGRHPLQATITSLKKPVAYSEVLCGCPHLVAKSGKAFQPRKIGR